METDARLLAHGACLEADVCVVGAGPAGLTLAKELGASATVVLLESGAQDHDRAVQSLNDGPVVGSPYHGLRSTRHRQIGGSANRWNTQIGEAMAAKYAPLDPIDFEDRTERALGGWPFGRDHLDPFYGRAHSLCALGAFDYDPSRWSAPERSRVPLPAGTLATSVYHAGPASVFTRAAPDALRASDTVHLVHHATCRALHTDGARRVVAADARSSAGTPLRVDAKIFVLAAGAVENARLLLLTADHAPTLLRHHTWVGRAFMEHPRDSAMRLVVRPPRTFSELAFYDLHETAHGAWILGRLGFAESTLREHGVPNASITLLPGWVRRPWLAALGRPLGARIASRLRSTELPGHGWSRADPVDRPFDAVQLLINLEQQPHPDNRVVLSSVRDAFGVPKPELHWRWRTGDQAALVRLRALLAERLAATGLGRVSLSSEMRPDPNAHHHSGTTRMSVDVRDGVVDADCRVHGTDNLYVAGSSVFPSAGFANPTLTIVALALRLADHLALRA